MYSFDTKKKTRAIQKQNLQRVYQFDPEDRDTELFDEIIDRLVDAMDDGK